MELVSPLVRQKIELRFKPIPVEGACAPKSRLEVFSDRWVWKNQHTIALRAGALHAERVVPLRG